MIESLVRNSARTSGCLAAALLALAPGVLVAQDDFFNTISVDSLNSDSANNDRAYSILGWVTQKLAKGLEDPGPLFSRQKSELNKVETSFFAQLDAGFGESWNFRLSGKAYHDEIYHLRDDTIFHDDELNEFRDRFEVRDFYIENQFDNGLYVKLGNQILAWGLAEYVRVTDLINIEDQYTFGQQDLENLRLQVPAVLFSYSAGDWTFDSVVTAAADRNDLAPIGDEFDQLLALRNSGMSLYREDPQRDTEFFFRASTRMAKGDLQFVAGEFNENTLSVDYITAASSTNPQVSFSQNRMRAIGVAGNWVEGSWLAFGELGIHMDKAVRPDSNSFLRQLNGWDQKDQVLGVLGLEYNGFRNLLLTVELDQIHTQDHDQFMLADKTQTSFGIRAYWTALNERLQVLGVWNELANDWGRVGRLSVEYNWSDNLDLGLLWVDYQSDPQSLYYNFRNNDILQLQLRYNFQI